MCQYFRLKYIILHFGKNLNPKIIFHNIFSAFIL
nr:MAG TPA: hypothetical protein [Caudoviricetes sp.]